MRSKEGSIYVQNFKSSIPLPYSLSKEGNLILKRMNRFKGSNIQSPENSVIYKKPNFCRELG
jgi:hypothetical protein